MLNFEEFKNVILSEIRNYLPITFADAEIEIQTIIKNNNLKLDGLIIKNRSNIAPTIYLQEFYAAYQKSENMKEIMQQIEDIHMQNDMEESGMADFIMDFERAKNYIFPELLDVNPNPNMTLTRPYQMIPDTNLGVFFRIKADNFKKSVSNDMTYTIQVTNTIAEIWSGKSSKELYDIALNNINSWGTCRIYKMAILMKELLGLPDEALPELEVTPMYVITNEQKTFGAAVVINEEFMNNEVCSILGDKFYMIPSSRHEWIVIPYVPKNKKELESLITTINGTEVQAEDVLSDYLYIYEKESGLKRAE